VQRNPFVIDTQSYLKSTHSVQLSPVVPDHTQVDMYTSNILV